MKMTAGQTPTKAGYYYRRGQVPYGADKEPRLVRVYRDDDDQLAWSDVEHPWIGHALSSAAWPEAIEWSEEVPAPDA